MDKKIRKPEKKFSREFIEGLAPEEKRFEVPDPGCHGLYLRVQPTGTKSWVFRYSIVGHTSRVFLGPWPAVTIDQARAESFALAGRVAKQEDPASRRKIEKANTTTVTELAKRFDEEHIATLRTTTQRGYRHYLKAHVLPALGRLRLQDVGLAQVADLKASLKGHPRTANYSIAVLSVMLAFAEEQGLRPPGSNPCAAVKRYKETRKQRFLDPGEILALRDALTTLEDAGEILPLPAAAIRLILLTGARHSEILHLRWEHVDLAAGRALLVEHKTMARGDRMLYLPMEAIPLLKSLPKHKLSPFVFAGEGKDGTIGSSLRHAWDLVRSKAGLDDVRIHDLRHTFASLGIASGLTLEQVGQLLGHSSPATTARYSHLVDESAKANVNQIAGSMKKAPGGA